MIRVKIKKSIWQGTETYRIYYLNSKERWARYDRRDHQSWVSAADFISINENLELENHGKNK